MVGGVKMDKKKQNEMPDFDSLDDRFIEESPSSPMLVIKTNLDPKDSIIDNPYYTKSQTDTKKFRKFFEGE
jgi:hypothetical protein